jgi:hypothetical protein
MKSCPSDRKKGLSWRGVVAIVAVAILVVVLVGHAVERPWDLYADKLDAVDYTISVDNVSMIFNPTLRSPDPEGDCTADLSGSIMVGKQYLGFRAVRVDLSFSFSRGVDATEGSFITEVVSPYSEWVRGAKAKLYDSDGHEMPGLTAKKRSDTWEVTCTGDGNPATGTISVLFLFRDWGENSATPIHIYTSWQWVDEGGQTKSHHKLMLFSVKPTS